ncbi:hypothetical protein ACJX0J_011359, partial [Zea mays]
MQLDTAGVSVRVSSIIFLILDDCFLKLSVVHVRMKAFLTLALAVCILLNKLATFLLTHMFKGNAALLVSKTGVEGMKGFLLLEGKMELSGSVQLLNELPPSVRFDCIFLFI